MKTALWICLITASLRADSTFWDSSRDGIRKVGITLSEGSFTPDHLEQVARTELARTPRASFIMLTIVGAKSGLPLPKAGRYKFENWRRLYDASVNAPIDIAEMIAIGDNAVLLVRDRTGRLTEKVLSGKNPLMIEAGGQHFRIVDVVVARAIAYGADVRFYLRAADPSGLGAGEELMRKLQSIVPNFDVSLAVQKEPWFVDDLEYPIWNPFVEHEAALREEDYLKMKTLFCGYVAGRSVCNIRGPAK